MSLYDLTFYDQIRAGCQSSAAVIVPLFLEYYPLTDSVADVGCGEGWHGAEFEKRGARAVGFDGEYVQHHAIEFRSRDLAAPSMWEDETFDVAVCLEVAEHLPPERAPGFVADLCALAPVVLFSAAIPGQDGWGHVNCQWPAYWQLLFEQHGYAMSGALRFAIWDDGRVEHWYAQNLMVCATENYRHPALFDSPLAEPLPLVHPVLYESKL